MCFGVIGNDYCYADGFVGHSATRQETRHSVIRVLNRSGYCAQHRLFASLRAAHRAFGRKTVRAPKRFGIATQDLGWPVGILL